MSDYRILSIDGGGIRGILAAVILERLSAVRPNFLAQFDLFAGTSTGGLLALGFASGLTPTEARQLYEEQGPSIFADSFWDNLKDLGFAAGAQYDNANLIQALTDQFGSQTLADLSKRALISAFDLDNEGDDPEGVRCWKPKFFHNYPGDDSDGDELVVDVGVRTAAVPTYFPVYQGYIDGGVAAINPSMCALAQALDADTGGQQLGDVTLLSLGTGRNPKYLPVQDADWGWGQWAVQLKSQTVLLPLLEIVLDGITAVPDYQCQRLLNGRYHRLNPVLPEPIGLDDVDNIPRLVEIAEQVDITETLAWIDAHF